MKRLGSVAAIVLCGVLQLGSVGAGRCADIHESTNAPSITVTLSKDPATDNLVGMIGSRVGPFHADVRYKNGHGLAGIPLEFSISQSPPDALCSLPGALCSLIDEAGNAGSLLTVTTDANGGAQVRLNFDSVAGLYRISVSSPNLPSQIFEATAIPPTMDMTLCDEAPAGMDPTSFDVPMGMVLAGGLVCNFVFPSYVPIEKVNLLKFALTGLPDNTLIEKVDLTVSTVNQGAGSVSGDNVTFQNTLSKTINQSLTDFQATQHFWFKGTNPGSVKIDGTITFKILDGVSQTITATANTGVVKVDINIFNAGSDLDNGQATGNQGSQVPKTDEKTIGAYLLVNWDDDDDSPTDFTTSPNPDLYQTGTVNDEDNLARLDISVDAGGLPYQGLVILECPQEDDLVRFWTGAHKGTRVDLVSSKISWNLASPSARTELQLLMTSGIWMEGIKESAVERDVTITLRYEVSGLDISSYSVRATVVFLELGVGAYRENALISWLQERGHGGLVFRYDGQCVKSDLTNDLKYAQLEMFNMFGGPQVRPLTYATQYPEETPPPAYFGLCRPATLSYADRLKILKAAHYLKDNGGSIWYVPEDAIEIDGFTWDGTTVNEKLDDVDALRCDGLVELSYEINAIDVWGKIVSGSARYSIYAYTSEHNEFLGDWEKHLQPFTQCPNSTTYKGTLWNTTFILVSGKTKPSLSNP